MTVLILPAIGLLLLSAAVSRYRPDRRALVAGVVVAFAGVVGTSLSLPEISLAIPLWSLFTIGGVAFLVVVAGSVYAESRLKRAPSAGR